MTGGAEPRYKRVAVNDNAKWIAKASVHEVRHFRPKSLNGFRIFLWNFAIFSGTLIFGVFYLLKMFISGPPPRNFYRAYLGKYWGNFWEAKSRME